MWIVHENGGPISVGGSQKGEWSTEGIPHYVVLIPRKWGTGYLCQVIYMGIF